MQKKIGKLNNIEYRNIDIENIPYNDQDFDYIIANMMLYHAPNLDKALIEVSRTLKNDGCFYCATFGENGLTKYINTLFAKYGMSATIESSFNLQNGEQKLTPYFNNVMRLDYIDSLEISNSNDLAEYILSMSTIVNIKNINHDQLVEILEKEKNKDGIIKIGKEYGMFIARK